MPFRGRGRSLTNNAGQAWRLMKPAAPGESRVIGRSHTVPVAQPGRLDSAAPTVPAGSERKGGITVQVP